MYIVILDFMFCSVATFTIFTNEAFASIRGFIERIFWIDIFRNEENFSSSAAARFLKISAYIFTIGFVFLLLHFLFTALVTLNGATLAIGIFFAIVYPSMYRVIMGINRLIYRKKV